MAATVWHILNMQWIQSPETENNVNRLKFDWKNSRNLITWSEFIKSIFYSFNKSHPSLRVQVQDRRIWNLWKLPPFQRSVIRLPRMKTSLTLKKMTVMMMLTKVRTTKLSIAFWENFQAAKNWSKKSWKWGGWFFDIFPLVFQVENGFLDKTMEF